jgi:hypothetical protein
VDTKINIAAVKQGRSKPLVRFEKSPFMIHHILHNTAILDPAESRFGAVKNPRPSAPVQPAVTEARIVVDVNPKTAVPGFAGV